MTLRLRMARVFARAQLATGVLAALFALSGCCVTAVPEGSSAISSGTGGTSTAGSASSSGAFGSTTTTTAATATSGAATGTTSGSSGLACDARLQIVPDPVAYVGVPVGAQAGQVVTATNMGTNTLAVTCISLLSLGFSCGTPSAVFSFSALPALPVLLTPGASFAFTVTYAATGGSDADGLDIDYSPAGCNGDYQATAPLLGNEALSPCSIAIAPTSLDFGLVAIGTPVVKSATLSNVGQTTCDISGVALSSGSDPSFSLDSTQPTAFSIPAGGSATLTAEFNLNNTSTPALRNGAIDFSINNTFLPTGSIPLVAHLTDGG